MPHEVLRRCGAEDAFLARADALSQAVFTDLAARYSDDFAVWALISIILSLFLIKLVSGLGLILSGLALHAGLSRSLPSGRPGNGVLLAALWSPPGSPPGISSGAPSGRPPC